MSQIAPGKLVVLTAIPDELDAARVPSGVTVLFTGIGKINAAIATLHALQQEQPALVVNYGTVGKINSSLTGLVEVAHVLQRDMIAEPLIPRGRTPFHEGHHIITSGYQGVSCGTGDSFVTSVDPWLIENKVDVVDMELFAIAAVCARHNVPWRAFKYITDDANEHAADHWQSNVADGQDLFWASLRREGLLRS